MQVEVSWSSPLSGSAGLSRNVLQRCHRSAKGKTVSPRALSRNEDVRDGVGPTRIGRAKVAELTSRAGASWVNVAHTIACRRCGWG